MEILFSVENFEENGGKYREINSPRSLEACLRSGLDPAELYPRAKKDFVDKTLTEEMVDIKYRTFEKKRIDKIFAVKEQRNSLIQYAERKRLAGTNRNGESGAQTPVAITTKTPKELAAELSNTMLEQEEKRIEALRRRQEKELNKIIEREQTLATLQLKIKHAEEEEIKKKKIHDRKVAEEHIQAEKKKVQRAHELKRLEAEEAEKKREIARKDAAIAEKLAKKRLQMEREMAKEARERDEERKQKVEEARRKTEALLKAQEDEAELVRIKMNEREQRIMTQLEQKKELKREEVASQREAAKKRINEALEKHHQLHQNKKDQFALRQAAAEKRAKDHATEERARLKKQADDREKRNKQRLNRLVEAYKSRAEHRKSIVDRREEREKFYGTIKSAREEEIALMKFTSDLRLRDKLDNVERVSRMNEFKRLQILQNIALQDSKYEDIQEQRAEMLRKHAEEAKNSLIRKHEISDAMDRMRMTNDFTLLDKLFASKKKKGEKKDLGKTTDDIEAVDEARLNQTI